MTILHKIRNYSSEKYNCFRIFHGRRESFEQTFATMLQYSERRFQRNQSDARR